MKDKAFIDTNIIIYMQSATEADKQLIARQVLDSFDCVASTQVLNEVSNVLVKKAGFSYEQIGRIIDGLIQVCDIMVVTCDTIRNAHSIAETYSIGYYDSLIVSSAVESDCKYLLSEDLTDGQKINDSITIINIFDHPEFFD